MAIGSLFGDALSGFGSRVQQGFSGIQDRFKRPNPYDPIYQGEDGLEKYWADQIDWQGRSDLLAQGISGIPQYKPDFRGRARVGGRRPTQYTSLMAGPPVTPYAPLYLDPRRRRQ